MSQIILAIQYPNPFEKSLRALMIAMYVSVAICQIAIRQFSSFGKSLNLFFAGLMM